MNSQPETRKSSDRCWPLRRADGTPFHLPRQTHTHNSATAFTQSDHAFADMPPCPRCLGGEYISPRHNICPDCGGVGFSSGRAIAAMTLGEYVASIAEERSK